MALQQNIREMRALNELRRVGIMEMTSDHCDGCNILGEDEFTFESTDDIIMDLINKLPEVDDEDEKVQKILNGETVEDEDYVGIPDDADIDE